MQTDVPCDGCTACCRSGQALFLHPEQGDDVEAYLHRTGFDPAAGKPVYFLATDENGACVYVGAAGCTIHERRPLLCRSFDCRKHYLMLPKQDRDNLVRIGASSRVVFDAGKARVKTLSVEEKKACREIRKEYFG